ncbi:MAG: hypothetical protein ACLP9L_39765 [Thermoguttaceae bacterium]
MRIWQVVVPSLFGLALAGCRNDPSIELLERDNFKKEQEIYRLRDENAELKDALSAAAPAQPNYLRGVPPGEMPPEPGTTEGSRSGPARTRPAPLFTPPGRTNSEPESPVPGGLNISPGLEVPPGEVPERLKVPGESAPPRPVLPPGGSNPGGSSQWNPAGGQPRTGNLVLADNSSVAQITLHPALTGGIGVRNRPSDEGLFVVVEPRDFGGNIVNVPGEVSVALLDPALSGEQARLGRWDFAAAETQGMLRTGSQPGIHLRLPWTSTPAHDRLKVFVRYTTRDGRKLQAERLISVALDAPPLDPREPPPDADPAQTASRPQRPQWSPVR